MVSEPRALLEWVVFGKQVVHVSTFSHLRKGDLPKVLCPECREEVILRRGKRRAHHYAHYPDCQCAATAPESAAHLNTKFYLAQALRDASQLYLSDPCIHSGRSPAGSVDPDCTASRTILFAQGWDEVVVERRMVSVQPDILLVKQGSPLVALEVHHRNAVSEAKAERLAELDLPWVEVAADPNVFRIGGWTPDVPLPLERKHPGEPWTCDHHQAFIAWRTQIAQDAESRRMAELERQERLQERMTKAKQEEERRARECRLLFVKFVHVYFPHGRVDYRTYRIWGRFPGGVTTAREVWLDLEDASYVLMTVKEPAGRATMEALDRALEQHVGPVRNSGGIIDSHESWFEATKPPAQMTKYGKRFPPRYRWVDEIRQWVGIPQVPAPPESASVEFLGRSSSGSATSFVSGS
jgi:hypothetical protein